LFAGCAAAGTVLFHPFVVFAAAGEVSFEPFVVFAAAETMSFHPFVGFAAAEAASFYPFAVLRRFRRFFRFGMNPFMDSSLPKHKRRSPTWISRLGLGLAMTLPSR